MSDYNLSDNYLSDTLSVIKNQDELKQIENKITLDGLHANFNKIDTFELIGRKK